MTIFNSLPLKTLYRIVRPSKVQLEVLKNFHLKEDRSIVAVEFDVLYLLEKASPEVAPKSFIAVFRGRKLSLQHISCPFLRVFIRLTLFLH